MPEVWMNERIMRVAPDSFAEFLTAFEERGAKVCSHSCADVVDLLLDGAYMHALQDFKRSSYWDVLACYLW